MSEDERARLIRSIREGQPLHVAGGRVLTDDQLRGGESRGTVPVKAHDWGASAEA